jgi:hypothetical protein
VVAGTPASFTLRVNVPVAARNSGIASAAMKTRMPITLTTTARPPSVMTPTATRSTRLRRLIRPVAAAIWRRTLDSPGVAATTDADPLVGSLMT